MSETGSRITHVPLARASRRDAVSPSDLIGAQRPEVAAEAATVEVLPVGRAGRRDAILAVLVVAALQLTLLKPWAGPAAAPPLPTPEKPAAVVSASVAASPSPRAEVTPRVPAMAFAPPAEACFDNARWRVCVLGSPGGQTVRSMFAPDRVPATGAAAPKTRTNPAILIVTTAGAGLGFYPPLESEYLVTGKIVVSAWRVGGDAPGTRWLALQAVGPMRLGARVAANVHVPESDALVAATRWPAGTFIVRLQAANGDHWDRFFAVTVTPVPGA